MKPLIIFLTAMALLFAVSCWFSLQGRNECAEKGGVLLRTTNWGAVCAKLELLP